MGTPGCPIRAVRDRQGGLLLSSVLLLSSTHERSGRRTLGEDSKSYCVTSLVSLYGLCGQGATQWAQSSPPGQALPGPFLGYREAPSRLRMRSALESHVDHRATQACAGAREPAGGCATAWPQSPALGVCFQCWPSVPIHPCRAGVFQPGGAAGYTQSSQSQAGCQAAPTVMKSW